MSKIQIKRAGNHFFNTVEELKADGAVASAWRVNHNRVYIPRLRADKLRLMMIAHTAMQAAAYKAAFGCEVEETLSNLTDGSFLVTDEPETA